MSIGQRAEREIPGSCVKDGVEQHDERQANAAHRIVQSSVVHPEGRYVADLQSANLAVSVSNTSTRRTPATRPSAAVDTRRRWMSAFDKTERDDSMSAADLPRSSVRGGRARPDTDA